jgi:6-phospho-beta-glucosidase
MIKVAVIGGGSTYTPELIKGFIDLKDNLPDIEFWLMDVDYQRLEVVAEFTRRLLTTYGEPFKIILTGDRSTALRGADYVITQLRVGQMAARREDEYLGKRNFLIGQETIGVGGMASALRTVPVIIEIAKEMRELAPDALMVNFTNPIGIISEALNLHVPDINAVGVCNSAYATKMAILKGLEKRHNRTYRAEDVEVTSLGLNHLTWYLGFRLQGEDIWPEVFEMYLKSLEESAQPEFNPGFIHRIGLIPNHYLSYYYNESRHVHLQDNWPPSRAEEVMVIEAQLLKDYTNPELRTLPEGLLRRGGAYYASVATRLINAHYNDLGETHIANVSHDGMVSGWEREWVLELPCRVDRSGVHPLPIKPLPLYNYFLLEQVKNYEIMTIEAAVHGDRYAAIQALITHPLGPVEELAEKLLNDMLETNRSYLPLFFKA